MEDYYIFEIPVYRCTKERFYSDMVAAVAKRHDKIFSITGISPKNAPESYKNVEEHTSEEVGDVHW